MAAGTFTATDTPSPARLSNRGITVEKATFAWSTATPGSLSGSDIIFMMRLPNPCTVLDGYITGQAPFTVQTFKAGWGTAGGASTDADFHTGATISATPALNRFNGSAMPIRVSASYDQTVWLYLTKGTTTSSTGTGTINFTVCVTYAADGVV